MLCFYEALKAQEFYSGILEVCVKEQSAKPKDIKSTFNKKLNNIFIKNQVKKYTQSLPFAKTPQLRELYMIEFDGDDSLMIKELMQSNLFRFVKREPKPVSLYEPSDYMWWLGWLWHLEIIKADLAWDITHGSSSVNIAVIDTDFDLTHPDLTNKINPSYDPYTMIQHSASGSSHGTTVVSFAGAETDGGGQLASIGFDVNIIAYTSSNGLNKAVHASTVMGADVISISWFSSCYPDPTGSDELKIKEILDNGTIICAAAGNGLDSNGCPHYYGGGPPPYNAPFPFSPYYDERIISVTSTSISDHHTFWVGGTEVTHSHFAEIDICAPGYEVMGATPTTDGNGDPVEWPYYGGWRGTSFATPITAGVCALMKSVNSSLLPWQVQDIIKATADPVIDAYLYPNMVGAGRINAFESVKVANCDFSSFPSPEVDGPSMVCFSPGGTFTFQNPPPGSTTINWTYHRFLLTPVSGQGTNIFTVRARDQDVGGEGWVQANMTIGDCVLSIRKNVWVGRPGLPVTTPDGDPPMEVIYGSSFMVRLFASQTPGAEPTTGEWAAMGSIIPTPPTSGRSWCHFNANSFGYGQWHVYTSNNCGISDTYIGSVIVPWWKFGMSPNPADDYVEITAEKKEYDTKGIVSDKYEVKILNNLKSVVYESAKTNQTLLRISTKHFITGTYYIHFIAGEQTEVKQLIIIH